MRSVPHAPAAPLAADAAPGAAFAPLLYERSPGARPLTAAGKMALALLVGGGFVAVHRAAAGPAALRDWSPMLGAILAGSLLALYYATHTLRRLWPRLERLVPEARRRPLAERLWSGVNDRTMLAGGLAFGTINCGMAWTFGPPYVTAPALASFYGGAFAAGFSCGMAVTGIRGVVRTVAAFAREMEPEVDFAAPDRCGGLLFVGHALLRFSLVTLFVGVLIALYVLNAPWTAGDEPLVRAATWFWALFPFAASLFVLLAPAAEVHHLLDARKEAEERELCRRTTEVGRRLRDEATPAEQRPGLREEFDYYVELRRELHRMRTWPFDPAMGTEYLGIFAAHGALVWQSLQRLVALAL